MVKVTYFYFRDKKKLKFCYSALVNEGEQTIRDESTLSIHRLHLYSISQNKSTWCSVVIVQWQNTSLACMYVCMYGFKGASTSKVIGARNEMMMDDYDGQMIFGDLLGLKLPDIRLTGEKKPRKNLTQKTCPDRGSNPGPQRDKRACYHLFHSGGHFSCVRHGFESALLIRDFLKLSLIFSRNIWI